MRLFPGEIAFDSLMRLPELLLSDKGLSGEAKIVIEFGFGQSDYDAPMIEGRMEASLTVECQRCLKAMQIPIQRDFKLLIDASDELVAASSFDTVYSEEGSIDIFEVVEDELILALPLVSMHDDVACNEFWITQEVDPEPATKESPFSVLAKLKTIN